MTKDDFAALHRAAAPLVLFNIWDAGSARIVAEAGAKALATGSLSLAGAQGYDDGEDLPFAALLITVKQIARATALPLSVDFETGYAEDQAQLVANAKALVEAGAIGCNLEDRVLGGEGLRDIAAQSERIAGAASAGLFVNARTDLFLAPLMAGKNPNSEELLQAAIIRAQAYHEAGAGCFFAPGLSDLGLIARLAEASALPLNIMRLDGMADNRALFKAGAGRISYGPQPWNAAMAYLSEAARAALG